MRTDDMVIITNVCPFCGKEHSVRVSESAFYEWEKGAVIQRVMPTLSATEREQLVSRICPDCQKGIFGDDSEDDEGDDIDACMRDSLGFTGQWW